MLWNLFLQPYPFGGSHNRKISLTLGISLFVFTFLFIFAPFGLTQYYVSQRLVFSLGFGAVCATAMAVCFYGILPLLSRFIDEEQWTVGWQILWFGCILLMISVFNSIYAGLVGLSAFSMEQLFTFILYVLLIGIFPVAAVVVYDYRRLDKEHVKHAKELKKEFQAISSDKNKKLLLKSNNHNEILQLKQGNLLYLSSEDNYVEIIYLKNSDIKKKLLRGSLKNFESQLNQSSIIRCHRSFMVNLSRVVNVSGNAQGYNLQLRGCDDAIPVSRSYADEVISQLDG